MDANMGNSGAILSYQPQPSMNVAFQATAPAGVLDSAGTNNVIEEEDYQ